MHAHPNMHCSAGHKCSRYDIQRQIEEAERLTRVVDVTEDMRYNYGRARELFNSGQLPEIRQLINLYLERVVVYKSMWRFSSMCSLYFAGLTMIRLKVYFQVIRLRPLIFGAARKTMLEAAYLAEGSRRI